MIGYLAGNIIAKYKGEVWVEVHGVGYRVRVGTSFYDSLSVDSAVHLFIHTAVREDAITLYGFQDLAQLQMFELLLDVSGVGPKTALTIVGSQSPNMIEAAVRQADVGFFQKVPGIGKKSAQRIIVDLKGKIPSFTDIDLTEATVDEDVMLALKQFGFKDKDIQLALQQIDSSLSLEEKVRHGLKLLGKG